MSFKRGDVVLFVGKARRAGMQPTNSLLPGEIGVVERDGINIMVSFPDKQYEFHFGSDELLKVKDMSDLEKTMYGVEA